MDLERFAHAWVQAMNQRDVEALYELVDPEIEVHIRDQPDGGVSGGDFRPVYRGLEEALAALEQWAEPWSELRLDIDRVIPEGEDRFLLCGTWHAVGRGSGVELSAPDYFARYTLREGRVASIHFVEPPDEAPD